jgi:hypothetical protein
MDRGGRILRGTGMASSALANSGMGGRIAIARSARLIAAIPINLLNSQADFHDANSTSPQNTLELGIR